MKKLFCLLLIPALFLSACVKESPEPVYVPEEVSPEDRELLRTAEVSGIFYALYNDNTCEITEADPEGYDSASLSLPSFYDKYTVVAIADEVFAGSSFTHVTLPLFLERIGKGAFEHTQITEVAFPDTLVELGEEAFSDCVRLKKVTFGKGLKEIPMGAFYGCRALREVSLPEGVEKIGEEAFGDLSALEKISLPSSLQEIGPFAFWHCGTDTLSFAIPAGVERIGASAFHETAWLREQTEEFVLVGDGVLLKYNGSARELTLPDTVKYLSNAFDSSPVETLTLPASLAGMADGALAESGITALYQNGNALEIPQ